MKREEEIGVGSLRNRECVEDPIREEKVVDEGAMLFPGNSEAAEPVVCYLVLNRSEIAGGGRAIKGSRGDLRSRRRRGQRPTPNKSRRQRGQTANMRLPTHPPRDRVNRVYKGGPCGRHSGVCLLLWPRALGGIGWSTARVSSNPSLVSAVSKLVGLLGLAGLWLLRPCRGLYIPALRLRKIGGRSSNDNKVSFG